MFLITVNTASAATVHVGNGQTYDPDGMQDQNEINQAIQAAKSGDIVLLHAGTYTITKPVMLKSGICLQGEGGDTIIYVSNKADFDSESESAMLMGNSVQNIEISNIRFKGPGLSPADIHDSSQKYYGGHGQYHAAMRFTSCTNVRVHDCSCTLLLNDFVRTSRCSGVYVYNNYMDMHGHDGCQFYNTNNIQAYNNYVVIYINCGIRVSGCKNATISRNTFTSYSSSGWNGVQIQGASTGIQVNKNVFSRMSDNFGCVGLDTNGNGCTITDNIGYNVPAGLVSNLGGATQNNNTMYNSEYKWAAWGYGYDGSVKSMDVYDDPDNDKDTTTKIIPKPVVEPVVQTTPVVPVATVNATKNASENVTVPVNACNVSKDVCEEKQPICNETANVATCDKTVNTTECRDTKTKKEDNCLKPVEINYGECIVRVYSIQNVTSINYTGEVTITKAEK